MYQFGSYSDQMKLNAESVTCLVICTTHFFQGVRTILFFEQMAPSTALFWYRSYSSRRSNQSMLEEINPEYTMDTNLSQFRETVEDR